MLRIRKLSDARTLANRKAVEEAQAIIRAQFAGISQSDIDALPRQIENPFPNRLLTELFVAEDSRSHVLGIAITRFAPDLHFAFLDIIATAVGRTGGGLGAALYNRVREDALNRGATGLYFECLPDEPRQGADPTIRAQNAGRLKFYERYGARPILGTDYEVPPTPEATDYPYLVFDGLGQFALPPAKTLREIVRAILERKYARLCTPEEIVHIVDSIVDERLHLRPPRYAEPEPRRAKLQRRRILLFINERHDIHHIRERGYVEAPVRIAAIRREIDHSGLFDPQEPRHYGVRHIRECHDGRLVEYIRRACAEAPLDKSLYPYVFPIRNAARMPRERSVLAGYWCIDTFTPLNRNAYPAARGAVDCALSAADAVLEGAPLAYALVRPPGHHAERRSYGGFCYFNNAAVAAQYLSHYGRVAVLDIDYHHGNGTQDIFYERADVLTVSVHGHPSFAYPYFTGFRDETGRGAGAGFNLNIPLPEKITPDQHRDAVSQALRRIDRFAPDFLVLALGLDTAAGDPTGTWSNRAADFARLGRMIGRAGYPTAVVQEGGYRARTLGTNARNFFTGLSEAHHVQTPLQRLAKGNQRTPGAESILRWREAVSAEDADAVRRLVESTGMFNGEEVAIAVELVEERVARGRASGYHFILAYQGETLVGYACYGPTAGTDGRFDMYWIVVSPAMQGRGLGREIGRRVEAAVARMGGQRIYVDTSSTDHYTPTRAYYEHTGYRKIAELTDFYRAGDGKVIYMKEIPV